MSKMSRRTNGQAEQLDPPEHMWAPPHETMH
jgi:hypothetical protein